MARTTISSGNEGNLAPKKEEKEKVVVDLDALYSSAESDLNRVYQESKKQAENAKQNSIAKAYEDYLKLINPYGKESEILNSYGNSKDGGYSLDLLGDRYSDYQSNVAKADSVYQNAISDIYKSKYENSADLTYKKIQDLIEASKTPGGSGQSSGTQGSSALKNQGIEFIKDAMFKDPDYIDSNKRDFFDFLMSTYGISEKEASVIMGIYDYRRMYE